MRQDLSYTTEATAIAGDTTQVRTDDGRLELTLSIPAELGGRGGDATNAEQLLAAGYAACLLSALQYAATRRGVSLPRDTQVRARLALTRPDEEQFAVSIELEATLGDLDAGLARRLIEEAKTAWPYSEPVIASTAPSGSGAESEGQRELAQARQEASDGGGYGG
jgi:lipoyl-dependent peroxiredoxin